MLEKRVRPLGRDAVADLLPYVFVGSGEWVFRWERDERGCHCIRHVEKPPHSLEHLRQKTPHRGLVLERGLHARSGLVHLHRREIEPALSNYQRRVLPLAQRILVP